MKTLVKATLALACATLATSAFAAGPKVPFTHKGVTAIDMANSKSVKWVTVDQIRDSLKNTPPITVSFDIDDTVLVSSQCFYYGKNTFSPNDYSYLKSQAFWNYVADGCDRSSIPKESAAALIKMHQERGDQVVFITGRTGHEKNDPNRIDTLGRILEQAFNVKNMQPVNYTKDTPVAPYKYDKTYYIVKHKSQIHYGDSNDDVLAAREAGIRGIRVIRTQVSTNRPLPINGGYGEEVLVNSSY
ncbi:acid phosphatase AphA [Kingella negevensis]|uniref:Class B acid phosphatase n=1 Tax=Kingella negevensis TaxID=1522312 RepID=A0A238HFC4_9NEIS|nr:acid phosphatase AphA [Kingella negevensis]MDK4680946.1 acid phosphatase AphA [Kingella negevensis]MDK4683148.1 acid phosphatase AphA [Kingella negevensis]MDK4683969.1 acid phosphatase AphA [Kingella negevensis]MDK4688005.1 acid phosphatase AphA [Kingella negevensis]MDK4691720.1 acid phosphatase AphA [Kingella negevensis]